MLSAAKIYVHGNSSDGQKMLMCCTGVSGKTAAEFKALAALRYFKDAYCSSSGSYEDAVNLTEVFVLHMGSVVSISGVQKNMQIKDI